MLPNHHLLHTLARSNQQASLREAEQSQLARLADRPAPKRPPAWLLAAVSALLAALVR